MPTWRCPYCGAPQQETARCWVCLRSTTCCATCRSFRRGVAGQLGYCGHDRRRVPLSGREQLACWERPAERRPETADRPGDEPEPAPAYGLWAAPAPNSARDAR